MFGRGGGRGVALRTQPLLLSTKTQPPFSQTPSISSGFRHPPGPTGLSTPITRLEHASNQSTIKERGKSRERGGNVMDDLAQRKYVRQSEPLLPFA